MKRLPSLVAAVVAREVRALATTLLAGLYPACCSACREVLGDQTPPPAALCGPCAVSLVVIGPDRCPRCGLPRPAVAAAPDGRSAGPCLRCQREPPAFHEARAAFELGGALSDAIHAFKYRNAPEHAAVLAALFAEGLGDEAPDADLLVPVPLHRRRLRRRGYNQAALLGRALARRWGIPLLVDGLARTRDTPPQVHEPSATARERNVAGAFEVPRPERVAGRRVVLLDDVMTTGATASACARVLRSAGAVRVVVRTLARG